MNTSDPGKNDGRRPDASPIIVRICTGTTCFVMGASELECLAELLTPEQASQVEVEGGRCLGYCKARNYGRAPFVEIDGRMLSRATPTSVLAEIQRRLDEKKRTTDGRHEL